MPRTGRPTKQMGLPDNNVHAASKIASTTGDTDRQRGFSGGIGDRRRGMSHAVARCYRIRICSSPNRGVGSGIAVSTSLPSTHRFLACSDRPGRKRFYTPLVSLYCRDTRSRGGGSRKATAIFSLAERPFRTAPNRSPFFPRRKTPRASSPRFRRKPVSN